MGFFHFIKKCFSLTFLQVICYVIIITIISLCLSLSLSHTHTHTHSLSLSPFPRIRTTQKVNSKEKCRLPQAICWSVWQLSIKAEIWVLKKGPYGWKIIQRYHLLRDALNRWMWTMRVVNKNKDGGRFRRLWHW